jgi:small-conductance mechanosensitive channel
MAKVMYSPWVRLILFIITLYFVWTNWSFLTMIIWILFVAFYMEKSINYKKTKSE